MTISGGAEVSGVDAVPPVWVANASCPPLDDVTGVRYNNGTLTANGNGHPLPGQPASSWMPTLNPTDMQKDFNKLKALATLILTDDNPAATGPAYTGAIPPKCDTDGPDQLG